ncbi:hypothetical protein V8D89_004390 [Ganoderma adspersum]
MDIVTGFQERAVHLILEPTLESRRSEIENHPQQTFQFGPTDRHQLDVHNPDPAAVAHNKPVPVLFFIYGSGFVNGHRKQAPPFLRPRAHQRRCLLRQTRRFRLVPYSHMMFTVIPDYRLYPHVTYPAPVEDVRDALSWVLANASIITSTPPSTLRASSPLSNFFVLGHSAGSNHVASLFLSPALLTLASPVRAGSSWAGARTCSTSRSCRIRRTCRGSSRGTTAQSAELTNMPLTLLADADEELVRGLPGIFLLKSERDLSVIDESNDVFVKALEGRLGKKVRYEVMKRHNHISPHWALLSGDGEEWAEDVAAWVKARI